MRDANANTGHTVCGLCGEILDVREVSIGDEGFRLECYEAQRFGVPSAEEIEQYDDQDDVARQILVAAYL